MRKLYVVCTTLILLIVLVHMFYMVGGLSGAPLNEDLAMNMGYTLMGLAVLHGIYGLIKWAKAYITKARLKKQNGERKPASVSAAAITLTQRITGVLVVALVFPHTIIKIAMANELQMAIDIVFVLAIIVHLLIGIPKWLVSAGLIGGKLEKRLSVFYGGKQNA